MEMVCTIRKQKQKKKIAFIIKRPITSETQCLKALKAKIERCQREKIFQFGSGLLQG